MSVREDLTFISATDTCAAWLYRPDAVAGTAPCVVMAHGFGGTRADRLPAYAERFAAAGMAVLLFDYRHFGDSTGTPRQLLDIGRQQADYHAAVAFARSLPGIDAQRVALFGTSFSGGHVVVVAAQDPSIAAVVAQCPFADGIAALRTVPVRNALRAAVLGLADQAAALAGRAPRTMPAIGAPGSFAVMTAPDAKPGFEALVAPGSRWRNEVAARIMLRVATYRPVRSAPSVACPLLVCACERDTTTPPAGRDRDGAARAARRGPALSRRALRDLRGRAVRARRGRPDGLPATPPGPRGPGGGRRTRAFRRSGHSRPAQLVLGFPNRWSPSSTPPVARCATRSLQSPVSWQCCHEVAARILNRIGEWAERIGQLCWALRAAELRLALPFEAPTRERLGADLRRIRARLN